MLACFGTVHIGQGTHLIAKHFPCTIVGSANKGIIPVAGSWDSMLRKLWCYHSFPTGVAQAVHPCQVTGLSHIARKLLALPKASSCSRSRPDGTVADRSPSLESALRGVIREGAEGVLPAASVSERRGSCEV